MPTRREVLTRMLPAAVLLVSRSGRAAAAIHPLDEKWTAYLESQSGGRLGVAVMTAEGRNIFSHRAEERFPMCSTFKLLAAAAVLQRADQHKEQLDRVVHYARADLLSHSPISEQHVATGMTLRAICEAAVTVSDNCAANQMLAALGGPAEVTKFLRSIGDPVTRLDRNEPTLNTAIPGDPRDTTTPAAMTHDLRKLVFGNALSEATRTLLTGWLRACSTGAARLRAGIPASWQEGDKTGTGSYGTSNDVAVLWPPQGKPLLAAAYLTGSKLDADGQNKVIAEVGRSIADWVSARR